MSNDYFKFKQFVVHHDRCAMKVGTDGVLLGAWAPGGKNILDIGTGTGLIAMMIAQRFGDSVIDAIEIDNDAVQQARENIEGSCFRERINIFHSSLQSFSDDFPSSCKHYDCIVSNPPFYTEDTMCPESKRQAARHTISLTYADLFKHAAAMLKKGGTFSIIVPCEAKEKIMFEACLKALYVKNICYVRTTPRKQPKRMLITFSNVSDGNNINEECCMMNPDGSRSDWYIALTDEFYL